MLLSVLTAIARTFVEPYLVASGRPRRYIPTETPASGSDGGMIRRNSQVLSSCATSSHPRDELRALPLRPRRTRLLHEGIPLPLIQRQLGHSHLSTTGTYLEGISSEEIISTVHARRAPMMHTSAVLAL